MPDPGFADRPRIVIWETTQACGLACVHCRADAKTRRDPRELTTAEGLALIDHLAAERVPLLILTGGDPMERDDLETLVRHGVARGVTMALSPSATPRVTPERLDALQAAGLHRLALSLDGPDASFHDGFRRVAGSFDRTLAIAAHARARGLPLQIGSTISTMNAGRLEELAGVVAGLGPVLWSVFFLVPTGRAGRAMMLDAAATEDVLHRLAALAERLPFAVKTTEAPHYRRVVLERSGKGVPAHMGVNDGRGFVFVSHTGEVFPSGFLPLTAGNVRATPLVEIYKDAPLFRALRDPSRLTGACGACAYNVLCGGSRARAWAVTGDPLGSEPTCAYQPPARVPAGAAA